MHSDRTVMGSLSEVFKITQWPMTNVNMPLQAVPERLQNRFYPTVSDAGNQPMNYGAGFMPGRYPQLSAANVMNGLLPPAQGIDDPHFVPATMNPGVLEHYERNYGPATQTFSAPQPMTTCESPRTAYKQATSAVGSKQNVMYFVLLGFLGLLLVDLAAKKHSQ